MTDIIVEQCSNNVVSEPSQVVVILSENSDTVILTGNNSTTLLGGTLQPVDISSSNANLCIAPYSTTTITTTNNEYLTMDGIAGESITPYKVVVRLSGGYFLADNTQIAHLDRVAGIALTGANIGESFTILTMGTYPNAGWSWDITKGLYLGTNGDIIQDEDLDNQAISIRLGDAIEPSRIFLDMETPSEII